MTLLTLYNFAFESEMIGRSVRPQVHRNGPRESALIVGTLIVFWILQTNFRSDRIGLKRL